MTPLTIDGVPVLEIDDRAAELLVALAKGGAAWAQLDLSVRQPATKFRHSMTGAIQPVRVAEPVEVQIRGYFCAHGEHDASDDWTGT